MRGTSCRLIEGKPKCVSSLIRRSQEDSNPCATNSCPAGLECKVIEVPCIDAPCPPIGVCGPPSGNNKCGTNETFKECASQCEPTCANKSSICIQMCAPGKCQCKPGFYRNTTGQCVTGADCGKYNK
ncbi:unnamed protein product [Cylicostephanus goldi]|uniref:TIL domain-containing protein n=1 Tax=Cylicostephanus goldi TaxID=71465 RepID=A0A3P7MD63_CYLGO|nr:unnamed protein product [Cylicostephanus goldi]